MSGYPAPARSAPDDAVLLRPDEAARRLAVSRSVVFRLMRSGELESITIGRARRVPAAAVDAYIAQRLAAR